MNFLWLVPLFWFFSGPYQIKEAIERYEIGTREMPPREQLVLFLKSLVFGPFTRSKLIKPIMIDRVCVIYAVVYEDNPKELITPEALFTDRERACSLKNRWNADVVRTAAVATFLVK